MDLKKIGLVMQLSFSTFDQERRQQFMGDLRRVSGCDEADMTEPTFWSGCVKFEAKMDPEAAEFILEMYNHYISDSSKEVPENIAAVFDFFKKYNISYAGAGLAAKHVAIIKISSNQSRKAVFVHGWRSDSEAFGKLPEFINSQTIYSPLIYQYPTGWTGNNSSIIFISQNFDNWIRNHIDVTREKFALIGHSMGGLIIRKMIANQVFRKERLEANLAHITFIASPHVGAWIAKALKFIPGISQTQPNDLRPDSPVLTELSAHWLAWLDQNPNMRGKIRSIFGTKDEVVDTSVAIGTDPEAVPILGAKHNDIILPKGKDDDIVKTLVRFLNEAK